MKKLKLLILSMAAGLCLSAQMPTNYLQITLYKNLLSGLSTCDLDSASNTVYIHAGAGYQTNSSLWDVVVGHWGIADAIGEMTTVDDSTYTIVMDLSNTSTNYFRANPVDSGSLPIGATIYNIGCVFRDQGPFPLNGQGQPVYDVHLKGGATQCSDFWILNINTGTPFVGQAYDDGGSAVNAVSATFVSSLPAGIQTVNNHAMDGIKASPNPFLDNIKIEFNIQQDGKKVSAQIYDIMGRVVADLTSGLHSGYNVFAWDGSGTDGNELTAGTYLLKVTNGGQILTKKIIKE